nr:hypothetical protein [Micromonospora siamensis]
MDVLSMWACIQDHDTANHWRQVSGWVKVCDLAQLHLGRLQTYREGLAQAWPPETSAASRSYLTELDGLIDRVRRTHDAASANLKALSGATRAIDDARSRLRPLFDEYVAKLGQKQAYEETANDPKAVLGSRLPTTPPVTEADLQRLDVQARSVMYSLSGELQQAQVTLRQPPPLARSPKQVDDPDLYGGPQAPVIPPIVAMPLPAIQPSPISRTTTSARSATTPKAPNVGPVLGGGSVAHTVSPTQPTPIAPIPVTGPGPVLGGAGPALASPATPPLPSTTPPAPPTITTGPGLPPALPPITGSTGRTGTPGPLRGQPGPMSRTVGSGNGTPHVPPTAQPRAMPPGGLIGGTPAMGLGQPGASNPPRRVNPVGGVIGGGSAGTGPSGSAGSRPGAGRGGQLGAAHGMSPLGGAPIAGGGRGTGGARPHISGGPFGSGGNTATHGVQGAPSPPGRRDGETEERRRWDPDHPWETDEGVAPVVRPPEDEGPIDPGPAIGFGR